MIDPQNIIALRMERQHLSRKATPAQYIDLYRDLQPGQNVYWNGFGDPPSLTYRADFNDIEFNRQRQLTHALVKGRFAGGNLGWIMPEDLALFVAAFSKPLTKPSPRHTALLSLIERDPLTIQQMKAETGMLVKEITPVLHRLQEAFLIYEDQYDGEWDRGWHKFSSMFPEVDLTQYSRPSAVKILLQRFAYRQVAFDLKMAKSFYKLPEKNLKAAIAALMESGTMIETTNGYLLRDDFELLQSSTATAVKSVYAMHRNDFLVKSNEHWLKPKFVHSYPDTLYYILNNGTFCGVVAGKFRYTPEVEDVLLTLSKDEADDLKDEILQAIHYLCGESTSIKRYQGQLI